MQEMKAKGETRNWAVMGAMIGTAVGAVLAIIELILYSRGAFQSSYNVDATSGAVFMGQVGLPLILVFFGMLGGLLIGAGTPRFNPHPQQGRGHNAYHFLRNWRNRPEPRV